MAVFFIGDSHVDAVVSALKENRSRWPGVKASRISRQKKNAVIGGIVLDDFPAALGGMSDGDAVVTLMGGGLHAVLGLVQHPEPFDFYEVGGTVTPDVKLIPRAVLKDLMTQRLQETIGPKLTAAKNAAGCKVAQALCPPPKDDAQFIAAHLGVFAERVEERGISPAALRAKMWRLHNECVTEICAERGIGVLPVPENAFSGDFLAPEYYAGDTVHANSAYGALVIDQSVARLK